MQKLSILLSFFIFFLMFQSCDKIENLEENEYFIDLTMARLAAENILYLSQQPLDTSTLTIYGSDFNHTRHVLNYIEILNHNNLTALYVFNYVQGGFVVLSSDLRIDPVLAYSTENHFDINSRDVINFGLYLWLKEQIGNFNFTKSGAVIPPYAVESVKSWQELFNQPVIVEFINQHRSSCNYSNAWYITMKKLLKTRYGQGQGYNDLLTDTLNCSSANKRPPVGCSITTVAQLTKFHTDYYNFLPIYLIPETQNSTIWNYKQWPLIIHPPNHPDYEVNNDYYSEMQGFMSDMGTICNANYKCGITLAFSTNGLNALGFTISGFLDLDLQNLSTYDDMISEILNNRPVELYACSQIDSVFDEIVTRRGGLDQTSSTTDDFIGIRYTGCHSWITDGVQKVYDCETNFEYSANYRIHMNWGWNGRNNGWFL